MAECPCWGICIGCTYIHSRNSKLRAREDQASAPRRSDRSLMSKLAVTARKDKLACVNTDIRTDGQN